MKHFALISLLISVISFSLVNITAYGLAENYEVKKIDFHYAPVEGGGLDYYNLDIYYSRNYFEHPSTEYDEHLATASLALASSTFTPYTVVYDEEWYLNNPDKNISDFEFRIL